MDISNLTADEIIERLFELEKELEGAKELGRREERAKAAMQSLLSTPELRPGAQAEN